MALVMKQDVALNPFPVRLFGAVGVVFEADRIAELAEKLLP
jgi:hypothetical protein